MADLLHELMDDVRADRASQLWKQHGRWVIYTAIGIVLVTAAMVYWQHHRRDASMRQTALYLQADDLVAKGELDAALAALDKISMTSPSGFHGMALLKKAQVLYLLHKKEESRTVLSELAKRDDTYGDIGKIMLNKETGDNISPLVSSRREWQAWNALSKGDVQQAKQIFAEIAAAENAPSTLRDRAQMMDQYLTSKIGK